MQKTRIQLNHLFISVSMLVLTSFCLQSIAADNSGPTTAYRMQKVVSNSNQQIATTAQLKTENQSNQLTAKISPPASPPPRTSSGDNMPYIIFALLIVGLVILIFIPGKYIRKPITIEEEETRLAGSNSGYAADTTVDNYMEYMEAEDEIERRLDAEEELDSMQPKVQGKMVARDRKYNNRVSVRRKK